MFEELTDSVFNSESVNPSNISYKSFKTLSMQSQWLGYNLYSVVML